MISSICRKYKPAWPSYRIRRRLIPKQGPVEHSLTSLTSLSPTGPRARVIVATHQATSNKAPVGTTRSEVVYELFYTALPPAAFTPADVVALYLHRGAFETVLADEDKEQDPDRWCSHTAWGQEFWQFSLNGSGTSALNWGMHSIPRPCARQNLLRHRWVSLRRLHLILSLSHLNQPP